MDASNTKQIAQKDLFNKKFLFKKGYDRWIASNLHGVYRLLLKPHEEDSHGIFHRILERSVRLRQAVSHSGDQIAINLLGFPARLNRIRDFLQRFISNFEKQRENTAQLATTSRDLDDTINQIVENVDQASSLSQNTHDLAIKLAHSVSHAAGIVEQSARNSSSISEKNRLLQKEILTLREVVLKVQNQVTLINSISERTNMLALNASIEAARAGDTGRGFSVVAEGVGSLAVQSKNALATINSVISDMQKKFESWEISSSNHIAEVDVITGSLAEIRRVIEDNAHILQDTLDYMTRARDLYTDINEKLHTIKQVAQQVSHTSLGISIKTENMTMWSKNIKDEIDEMFSVINDTTRMITTQNPVWLLDFLRFRRSDHLDWIRKVKECISHSDAENFPELDHTKCKMGLWYYHAEVVDDTQKRLHESLEEPHRMLHMSARILRSHLRTNNRNEIEIEMQDLESHFRTIAGILDEYERYLEERALHF